ncbi:hypothetical protein KSS87_000502, partial [Heliosperma pusillum]
STSVHNQQSVIQPAISHSISHSLTQLDSI